MKTRVKTPTILQMEAVECGAASLAMILAHFGRYVPLEQLRMACGVSRDGSKAGNIVRAARTFGLEAKGWKKEPSQLREMPLPLVVFWEFNHFLVVEGWGKDAVFLNDPALGARIVTSDEFDRSFTGVALTFAPGEGFVRDTKRESKWRALKAKMRGFRGDWSFAALCGLLLVLPGLAIPVFSKIFVDEVLVGGLRGWVLPLLLGMALAAAMRAALTSLQNATLLRLETALSTRESGAFFGRLLQMPASFWAQRSSGEVASRAQVPDQIAQLWAGELAPTLLGALTAVFYLALMMIYDPLLTVLGVLLTASSLGISAYALSKTTTLSQRLAIERGQLLGSAMSGLQLIETLKASGAENDFFARWSGQHAKVLRAQNESEAALKWLEPLPALAQSLTFAIVLLVGGWRVMRGDLSVGGLVAFQSLLVGFSLPVSRLTEMGSTFQEAGAALSRLEDIERAPLPVPSKNPDAPPHRLAGHLELRGVHFGYNPLQPPLLQDFNLKLAPGARVALVGASGSGKSTVSRLVSGLWQPQSGEILFDGRPRDEYPPETLSGSIGYVSQETWLFGGTLFDNLTLWDQTAPREVVIAAAHEAQIHEAIAARPGAYESLVSEGGANFSGGQRQRLEIARALALNPSILILDEATSALDAATEKQIDDALRRRGCTCLIVAHRLSTIRDCDEILVMEAGRVVERGTHDSLLELNGAYARLVAAL